ncbi:MAG TPA: hypothetical protein VFE33_26260, partial [Thermoanaerobaculia bacterium]|nr:hypothetical protein [Thermoanaerobaculia bacterium]
MAAQIEKVVGRPDPFETEKIGPDSGEDFFDRSPRRQITLLGSHSFWNRQGLAVHLAVRSEGQRPELDEGGGHHVVRQPLAQRPSHLVDRQPGNVTSHIGDQPPIARIARRIFARHHYRLTDPCQRRECRFDLAQLDAKAADLDLGVAPPQKLQIPIGPIAGAIPGTIEKR